MSTGSPEQQLRHPRFLEPSMEPAAAPPGPPPDDFAVRLAAHLRECGEAVLQQHHRELERLRQENDRLSSRLCDLSAHLEAQDHPAAWVVPDEPPLKGSDQQPKDDCRCSITPTQSLGLTPELGADSAAPRDTTKDSQELHRRVSVSSNEGKGHSHATRLQRAYTLGTDVADHEDEMAASELSEEGPVFAGPHFVPREIWSARLDAPRQASLRRIRRSAIRRHHHDGSIVHVGESCMQGIMVHPQSTKRRVWSTVGLLLLCCELVSVPVEVCFGLPVSAITVVGRGLCLLFWFSDIFVRFLTGINMDGYTEMRPQFVARRYLSRWFTFDLALVLCDAFVLVTSAGALRVVSMLRAPTALRFVRVLRTSRIWQLASEALLYVNDGLFLVLEPMKTSLILMVYVHLLGCTWYAVGSMDAEGWVARADIEGRDLFYQYVYSTNWAVAQFSGSMTVTPRTMWENLFSSLSGMFALIMFTFFIGKMVHAVQQMSDQGPARMQLLCRQYLQSRHISGDTAQKLRMYFLQPKKGGFAKSRNLRERLEHESKLVEDLPVVLQMDLYEEVRRPLLELTQLFSDLRILPHNTRVLRELCYGVIKCDASLPGELVFSMGGACSRTFIIESGKMTYLQGEASEPETPKQGGSVSQLWASDLVVGGDMTVTQQQTIDTGRTMDSLAITENDGPDPREVSLDRGQLISEAVLWTSWTHCGDLAAEADTTMLTIDSKTFADVLCGHSTMRTQAVHYATTFVEYMNSLSEDKAFSDLLEVPANLINEHEPMTKKPSLAKDHFIFISHYKKEAGTEATLLEEGFHRIIQADQNHAANDFRRPVFLDSEDLQDTGALRRHVRRSHNLALLLTPQVLSRPWCLLELVTAVRAKVPIVPIEICRPGVSFRYPNDDFFEKLCRGETLTKEDIRFLRSKGIKPKDLACIKKVFGIIAITFSPHKSGNIREAELENILKRCSVKKGGSQEKH